MLVKKKKKVTLILIKKLKYKTLLHCSLKLVASDLPMSPSTFVSEIEKISIFFRIVNILLQPHVTALEVAASAAGEQCGDFVSSFFRRLCYQQGEDELPGLSLVGLLSNFIVNHLA